MTFEATRKKQNLVLVPRGKALYEDESSFGSRMLKSMGWEKGKGLGKEQHGNVDFIQIRYKQDANGLGFEKLKDNQWTQHEDTFNSLLKSLNNENKDNSAGEEQDVSETLKNRKSLESLSKNSKSRVHYKRYTRGKDISRYSEKDLANIFGKKSLTEEKPVIIEPLVVEEEEEPEKAYESNSIVNTGVSVNDYFKNMMAKKQNRILAEENNSEVVNELAEVKKDKKKSKPEVEEEINETLEEETITLEEPVKKKKCKKSKRTEETEEVVVEAEEEVVKVKKSKKKHQEDPVIVEAVEEFVDEEPPKKKKKKKSKDIEVEEAAVVVETIVEAELPSKKKSKKRKAEEMSEEPSTPLAELPAPIPVSSFNGKNCAYSTNVIQINTTVAEKLASLTVDQFTNSNISNIVGYGLTEEIELKTVQTKMVEDRGKLDKYSLYNMVSSKDRINKKKLFSKLKRPKNSFQVL